MGRYPNYDLVCIRVVGTTFAHETIYLYRGLSPGSAFNLSEKVPVQSL